MSLNGPSAKKLLQERTLPSLIDWCCFYYFVRNSLVALLETLCARIFSWDSWISVFFWHFFSPFLLFLCVCKVSNSNSRSIAVGPFRGLFPRRTTSQVGYFWDLAKRMSKCLHWSVTAMPAEACAQLPFWGGILLIGSNPPPPQYLGQKSEFAHWNLTSPKIPPPPIHNVGLCYQMRKPPLPNPSSPYENWGGVRKTAYMYKVEYVFST